MKNPYIHIYANSKCTSVFRVIFNWCSILNPPFLSSRRISHGVSRGLLGNSLWYDSLALQKSKPGRCVRVLRVQEEKWLGIRDDEMVRVKIPLWKKARNSFEGEKLFLSSWIILFFVNLRLKKVWCCRKHSDRRAFAIGVRYWVQIPVIEKFFEWWFEKAY